MDRASSSDVDREPRARIVMDLGATHLRSAVAVGDRLVDISTERVAEAVEESDALARIVDAHRAHLARRPALAKRPVGIGIAGAIDRDGIIRDGTALGLPHAYPLRERLESELDTAVVVDNDANMAALGEHRHGAAAQSDSFLLLSIGTNLGMGIVLDGEVHVGAVGAAGEIGTIPLPVPADFDCDADGPELTIGGLRLRWIEELFGGRAMRTSYERRARLSADPTIRVVERADAGDPVALEVLDEAITGWAYAIATAARVFDPDTVIVGGGIADDLTPHLPLLQRRTSALLPTSSLAVRPALLGPNGGLVGAGVAATRIGIPAP